MNIQQFDEHAATPRFLAIKEHLFSEMKDEAVILSVKNGKYYGVNAVGASIWKAIQEPVTFQEIQSSIMQEYDVDQATCQQEISTFLKKMQEEGLVEISDEKAV